MNSDDLRNKLLTAQDKFSLLSNMEALREYSLTVGDFGRLINEFLSDSEKANLLQIDSFKNANPYTKRCILDNIKDASLTQKLLLEPGIIDNIEPYYVKDIINKLPSQEKMQLICNRDFMSKCNLQSYDIQQMIVSLPEENQLAILSNSSYVKDTLKIEDFYIRDILANMQKDENKLALIGKYSLDSSDLTKIVSTLNDKNKETFLLGNKKIETFNIREILKSFDANNLMNFFINNAEYCKDKKIKPHEIISKLSADKQLQIAQNLITSGFDKDTKIKIVATLSNEVKDKLNKENYPADYQKALSLKSKEGYLDIELDRNPEDYKGLDELMAVNPERFSSEQKNRLKQLCAICPEMGIANTINGVYFSSTGKEFLEGEKWIESVLSRIKPEYSKAQKVAIIDNAIGRRISYSPDYDAETFVPWDSRALWKIISTGYGVCNGISRIEQYMLEQVGVPSRIVSSGKHAFLKLEDMEFELANGEKVTGTTLVDPTWNLDLQRYGCKPNNLFLSYEDIRKKDIMADGTDRESHKNDEALQDATFTLDQQSLRNLCISVGLARPDGKFPVVDFIEKAKQIDEIYADDPEKNIEAQLKLVQRVCPEFAQCQNSTMQMLKSISFNNPNLKFKKCVINRVYEKDDEDKNPVMFVYFDSDKLGKKFYYADKEQGQFIELPSKEFEKRFECFENDIEKNNGHRFWEDTEQNINIQHTEEKEVEGGDR